MPGCSERPETCILPGPQGCDIDLWRCIMAALRLHSVQPADLNGNSLSHIQQVRPVHCPAEAAWQLLRCNLLEASNQCGVCLGTALVLALHQAMSAARPLSTCTVLQAYELLRIDMHGQEAELAAAALPGLLDAAQFHWTRRNENNKAVRCYLACTAALLDATWQPVRVLRSSQCLAEWEGLGMLEHT